MGPVLIVVGFIGALGIGAWLIESVWPMVQRWRAARREDWTQEGHSPWWV